MYSSIKILIYCVADKGRNQNSRTVIQVLRITYDILGVVMFGFQKTKKYQVMISNHGDVTTHTHQTTRLDDDAAVFHKHARLVPFSVDMMH